MSDADQIFHGAITGAGGSAAAKQVVPVTTINYPISSIALCNAGTGTIYIGGPTVDASNGYPLKADQSIAMDEQEASLIYAFLSNTQDLRWIVLSK